VDICNKYKIIFYERLIVNPLQGFFLSAGGQIREAGGGEQRAGSRKQRAGSRKQGAVVRE